MSTDFPSNTHDLCCSGGVCPWWSSVQVCASLLPLSLTLAGISQNRRGPGPNIPVFPDKDTEVDLEKKNRVVKYRVVMECIRNQADNRAKPVLVSHFTQYPNLIVRARKKANISQ